MPARRSPGAARRRRALRRGRGRCPTDETGAASEMPTERAAQQRHDDAQDPEHGPEDHHGPGGPSRGLSATAEPCATPSEQNSTAGATTGAGGSERPAYWTTTKAPSAHATPRQTPIFHQTPISPTESVILGCSFLRPHKPCIASHVCVSRCLTCPARFRLQPESAITLPDCSHGSGKLFRTQRSLRWLRPSGRSDTGIPRRLGTHANQVRLSSHF